VGGRESELTGLEEPNDGRIAAANKRPAGSARRRRL